MLHIALWEPEIPPNTGNIARLCAATGTRLHLIGRLGFRLDDRSLKRAGLDYWPAVDVAQHATFEEFDTAIASPLRAQVRPWIVETPFKLAYTGVEFRDGDCLLFGNESRGLPAEVRGRHADRAIGIPMPTGKVRSLNLATAAGIVLYEALRQIHKW
jgi:tRNA (cytidine/uridine-2'-O-)-methyltransferase